MENNVRLSIDGKALEAVAGTNIIEVARNNGIDIPNLCYFPNMGKCLGTCRICTIKWKRHHVAACVLQAEEGMELTVHSKELNDLRLGIVELLFVEGNHFCPGCEKSGDCQLQALGYKLKMMAPRFHYRFRNHSIDFSAKKIIFEHNRCVLCKRCTDKFEDQNGKKVFAFKGKGTHLSVEMQTDRIDALSEELVENLVELCPVGAILKKGSGFQKPYGSRKYDKNPIGVDQEEGPHE